MSLIFFDAVPALNPAQPGDRTLLLRSRTARVIWHHLCHTLTPSSQGRRPHHLLVRSMRGDGTWSFFGAAPALNPAQPGDRPYDLLRRVPDGAGSMAPPLSHLDAQQPRAPFAPSSGAVHAWWWCL